MIGGKRLEKTEWKLRTQASIDDRRHEIIDLGETIYRHPETGFKEFATSALVARKFRELGLNCLELADIPGVKVTIDTGRDGPGVAILGELDAVICPDHPDADKETGAAHACGHNIQVAAMIGAAMGMLAADSIGDLAGKIHFIAVPAEEYIEISYRMELRDKGSIRYLGGKPELLHRGLFDDVDMCLMVHAIAKGKKFAYKPSTDGCLVKKIRYIGKPAHAGAAPHEGVNALYAANIGLMAINCLRETFQEQEFIRVHPIITKGGDAVNVIPGEVLLETFVRGRTKDDIIKANEKVNRALIGGAIALGAQVEIEDIPGYFPLVYDPNLIAIAKTAMAELVNGEDIIELGHGTGSTDLGDLSALMPVMQPYVGGVSGGLHSAEFALIDPDTSYLLGAKLLVNMAIELLWHEAETAKSVMRDYRPIFEPKEEYFAFVDRLFSKKLFPKSNPLDL